MSAFSRGFIGLGLSQRIFSCAPKTIPFANPSFPGRNAASFSQAIRNSPILQCARNLQTSASLRAAKPKVKLTSAKPEYKAPTTTSTTRANPPPPPRVAPSTSSSGGRNAAASIATATRLAALGKPTVLYESTSHFWFHFFSLLTSTFCVTYAGVHYYSYVLNPPQACDLWLQWVYGFICVGMLGLAWYFLYGTTRIVRRITAVPRQLVPQKHFHTFKGQSPKQANEVALLKQSPVAIEITLSQISSLTSEKKIMAAPSEVWLAVKMQELTAEQEAKKEAAGPMVEPDPARDTFLDRFADSVNTMFRGAKRALSKGDFLPIKVHGERYRLDIAPGAKVLDNGKSADALMPTFPDKFNDGAWSRFTNT